MMMLMVLFQLKFVIIMIYKSGKFDNTTKVKIETPYGNILKVTHYHIGEEPYDEYKVRPKCAICGGKALCMCFSDDNSDNPEQEAIDSLQRDFTCEKPHCICEIFKRIRPEEYAKLEMTFGNDIWSICEELQEKYYMEDDDGLFCET